MKSIKKLLMLVLLVAVIVTSISSLTLSASAVAHTQSEAVAWANSKIGVGLNYDGAYGNQCVDLIFYYYTYLGGTIPSGDNNACNFINNTLPSGWTRISSNIVPQPGDIAVWKTNHTCGTCETYWAGHIGIVVSGNSSTFTAVNQNFGFDSAYNAYCTKNQFNTSALACVIRPNFSGTSTGVTVSWSEYADKHWVGSTNAVLARTCNLNGVDNSAASKVGIYLYDYKGTELKSKSENISFSGYTYFNVWYDISGELGYTLSPGTPYKYKFMVVINGKTYYSPVYSFTTTGTHSHKYNSGTVTTSPGCTANGVRTYTCTTCGGTKTEAISKTGHSYGSWSTTKAATCTAAGTQKRTCSKCGGSETKTLTALGHNYSSSWTVDKAATCTAAGSKSQHCTRCSAKRNVTSIAATGHSYGSWSATKAATCTAAGTEKRTCSKCSAYEIRDIKATGHKFGSWQVSVAATTEKAGTETRKCSNNGCKAVETKTIPKLPQENHTHKFGEWHIEVQAGCETEGLMASACATCSEKQTQTISAVGHKYSEWKQTVAPTTEAEGVEERACENCSGTEQRAVAKLIVDTTISQENTSSGTASENIGESSNDEDGSAKESIAEIFNSENGYLLWIIMGIGAVLLCGVVIVVVVLITRKRR